MERNRENKSTKKEEKRTENECGYKIKEEANVK